MIRRNRANKIYLILLSLASVALIVFFIIKALEKSGIKVDNPDRNYKNFLFNFIEYISNAVVVLCNASTLTLSLSFLYHEEIYFPSKKNNYLQKVLIDEAHNSFPATLNWK